MLGQKHYIISDYTVSKIGKQKKVSINNKFEDIIADKVEIHESECNGYHIKMTVFTSPKVNPKLTTVVIFDPYISIRKQMNKNNKKIVRK